MVTQDQLWTIHLDCMLFGTDILKLAKNVPLIVSYEDDAYWVVHAHYQELAGVGRTWEEAVTDFSDSVDSHLMCYDEEI